MAQVKKKYKFKGLDTRTNKLYRQEGTASDCRNVFLNSNGDLIKRPDFETLSIPRAASGTTASTEITGDFIDKLPPDAEIIDFLKYEDHFLLVCRVLVGDLSSTYYYANKFYRYFEDTNIVELVAIAGETTLNTTHGTIASNPLSCVGGKLSSVLQEEILYFMGDLAEQNGVSVSESPIDEIALKKNLCYLFYYDGLMVGKAGVPSIIKDTVENEGVLSTEDYVRLVPFKLDSKNRITYGNYSTHKTTQSGEEQTLTIPASSFTEVVGQLPEYQCHVQITTGGPVSGSTTLDANVYSPSNNFNSVMTGQYLYYIEQDKTFITPNGTESYFIYRLKVLDVDYGTAGNQGDDASITLGQQEIFDTTTQSFKPTVSVFIDSGAFLSNHIFAVYASDQFTFDYKLKGYAIYAFNFDSAGVDFTFSYLTEKGASLLTNITRNTPLLAIAEEFEDGYDEVSVKLVPPRGYQVIDYLGALLVVDHEKLYFSDISVGGSIEVFTPFDNFKVGSSKRGRITGVFANETFIAVFREEEAYHITGNIFLSNYRIQSYQSTRIGCTDPRSIIDFRGAGVFLSKRGFQFCQQGGAMSEISEVIETIFTDGALGLDLDLSKCSAIVDFNREYIYFHVSSNSEESGYIFAFSYFHNEWFLWGEINANNGFRDVDSVIYYSDGITLYKESSTSSGSLAYYRSNFETLGVPSFEKKFHRILLYTIDMPARARITIKSFRDWIIDKWDTKESKTVKPQESDMTQRLDPARSKSLAFQIESPANNSLVLNGYEYEFEADVQGITDDD